MQLNKNNLKHLPKELVELINTEMSNGILHFGVGGFHRAHQAHYIQQFNKIAPSSKETWSITGACILPHDRGFVEQMKNQDFLYSLKTNATNGTVTTSVISSISQMYFGPTESSKIVETLASEDTKVVSFTITEGGYMVNGATGKFMIDHPLVQKDLEGLAIPHTVFGYLAQGLGLRRAKNRGKIILLSCDNVQENGQVLQYALEKFLGVYDPTLIEYVRENVCFPNSMVDRITPATTEGDKASFEKEYGYRDECLVLSEDFCQWILAFPAFGTFPPLNKVGVLMVNDVRPYEKMKLRILNGGHSLVGFLGKAMGYGYIHEAIGDPLISKVFDRYVREEAIPSLDPLENMDYVEYAEEVKGRFANKLICDSTDRIISFSSAKIPKFVLPVLKHVLTTGATGSVSHLIVAAWWHYIRERVMDNRTDEIQDGLLDHWMDCFTGTRESSVVAFLDTKEVFGQLGAMDQVKVKVQQLAAIMESKGMGSAIAEILNA